MKNSILSLPNETIGSVLRELYAPYEKNLRNMFNDSNTEFPITPKQVVEAFRSHGLEEYAIQFYVAFYGFFLGIRNKKASETYQEVKSLIAAYRMADELGVNVSEIDPEKALEYYKNKKS